MGLDIANDLFGLFHLNWGGTIRFRNWCFKSGLPGPFIGWGGDNSGDQCRLKAGSKHAKLAEEWCRALEQGFPDLAQLGTELTQLTPDKLSPFLYTDKGKESDEPLPEDEWERRFVAAWYAILRHGIAHGDTLEYW